MRGSSLEGFSKCALKFLLEKATQRRDEQDISEVSHPAASPSAVWPCVGVKLLGDLRTEGVAGNPGGRHTSKIQKSRPCQPFRSAWNRVALSNVQMEQLEDSAI